MTLSELREQIEFDTDNEFDDDTAFVHGVNRIITSINTDCATQFPRIPIAKLDNYLNSNEEWNKILGVPAYLENALTAGLEYEILHVEQEDDRDKAKEDFDKEKGKLMFRMPADHSQRSDISFTSYEMEVDWEDD